MRLMLLAVFSSLCLGLYAQITVTAATFPSAGDTLRFATDTIVDDMSFIITPPGGNQLWNLTNLEAHLTSTVAFRPATEGMNFMSFPGADLFSGGVQGESYFDKTSTKLDLLGYAGPDPANFNLDVLARFTPPLTERRAPMNFFDVTPSTSNLTLAFSTEALPDSLFAGFPLPDSLRVRITTERLDVVDGWGNCVIPGGQYPVLRQKRTEYTTTNLDVYITSPFPIGWIDISQFIPGGGGVFGAFLGTDTTVLHTFYSGTEKEPIATMELNDDQSAPVFIQYKNTGVSADEEPDAPGKAGISAFPNPAVERVRFDCVNLPPSEYTLKVFNIVGKVVWKQEQFLSGNKSISVELENFKKGTYLYSLTDAEGNVIGTKRLVVLKP